MIYKYTAFEEDKRVNGQIESETLKDCEALLLSKGLRIIKIEEVSQLNLNSLFSKKFNETEMYIFFYQLYILIDSKITVPESIYILSQNYKSDKKTILNNVYNNLIGGTSLADSLKNEDVFPKFVENMIKVGEKSSNLKDVLKDLSDFYFDKQIFRKKLHSTIAYPIILLIVTIVIINFVVLNILPNFIDIFKNAGVDIPLITKVLISSALFIKKHILIILSLVIILAAVLLIYCKREKGKYLLETILLKSKFYRDIQVQNFVNMLSFLLSAGVVMTEALEIVMNSSANLHVKEEVRESITQLYGGVNLSDSLNNSKFFDNITLSILKVGEKSSSIDRVLKSLKKYYEKKIEIDSKRFLSLVEPVIILLLSVFVGFVVFSIAIPMFDITNYIG